MLSIRNVFTIFRTFHATQASPYNKQFKIFKNTLSLVTFKVFFKKHELMIQEHPEIHKLYYKLHYINLMTLLNNNNSTHLPYVYVN